MLRNCFIMIFFIPCSIELFGQNLKVGERFPFVEFDSIFGFSKSKFTIPNDEAKFIVLDFWSTACSSCIMGISKIDSIERTFFGKVQIIPINDQGLNTQEVQSFWQSNKILKKTGRGSVVDYRNEIRKMIPRNGVPFFVFIDRSGRFRGSGGYEYFRVDVLNRMLTDSTFNIESIRPKKFFQVGERLFKDDFSWQSNNTQSAWFKFGTFKEEYHHGVFDFRVTNKSQRVVQFLNLTIKDMYNYCFRILGYQQNEFKINISDSLSEFRKSEQILFRADWDLKNRYTAEFKFPWFTTDESVGKTILGILDLNFLLETNIKKRKVEYKKMKKARREATGPTIQP